MHKRTQYWCGIGLGMVCVLVVAVNMGLSLSNQRLLQRTRARQQFIEQGVQMRVLYRQMVQAIAVLSVRNHDARLNALLARSGVHVTVKTPVGGAASSALVPGDKTPGLHHE